MSYKPLTTFWKAAPRGAPPQPPLQPTSPPADVIDIAKEEDAAAAAAAKAAAAAETKAKDDAVKKEAQNARAKKSRAKRSASAGRKGIATTAVTSLKHPSVTDWKKRYTWLDLASASAAADAKHGSARCITCPTATFALSLTSIKSHDKSAAHAAAASSVAVSSSVAPFIVRDDDTGPELLNKWRSRLGATVSAALVAGGVPPHQFMDVLRPLRDAILEIGEVPSDAAARQHHIPMIAKALRTDFSYLVQRHPGVLVTDGSSTAFGDGTSGSTAVSAWAYYSAHFEKPLFLRAFLSRKAADEPGTVAQDIKASGCRGAAGRPLGGGPAGRWAWAGRGPWAGAETAKRVSE